jgi:hypothetical protein
MLRESPVGGSPSESDLDRRAARQDALEVSHGSHAAESAAEDDDAHVRSEQPDHFGGAITCIP